MVRRRQAPEQFEFDNPQEEQQAEQTGKRREVREETRAERKDRLRRLYPRQYSARYLRDNYGVPPGSDRVFHEKDAEEERAREEEMFACEEELRVCEEELRALEREEENQAREREEWREVYHEAEEDDRLWKEFQRTGEYPTAATLAQLPGGRYSRGGGWGDRNYDPALNCDRWNRSDSRGRSFGGYEGRHRYPR